MQYLKLLMIIKIYQNNTNKRNQNSTVATFNQLADLLHQLMRKIHSSTVTVFLRRRRQQAGRSSRINNTRLNLSSDIKNTFKSEQKKK